MPAQWTADVIGEMHLYNISFASLAKAAGYHPKYLSAVLHGHRNPKKAEEKIRAALDELIAQKNHTA